MRKLLLALSLLLVAVPAYAALKSVLQITIGSALVVDLNFASNTATGCSDLTTSCLTVTRTTAETCTDASGTITYQTSGNACITTAGLAVWPASTNLQTHSALDSGWTLSNATAAINVTPPDGNANTGTTLTDNNTSGSHNDSGPTITVVNGTLYISSCYFHDGTSSGLGFAQIAMANAINSANSGANINLTTGAVANIASATGIATNAGNGWWRLAVRWAATANASGAVSVVMVTSNAATRFLSYVGTNSTIQVWGCQTEAQSNFVTPYIPTTTATVTRNADNIAVASASLLETTLNAATGTVVANVQQVNTHFGSEVASTVIDSNGTIFLGKTSTNTLTTAVGASLSTATTATWTNATDAGLAWDASGGTLQLQAGTKATDAQARTPATTFHLGSTSGSSAFFFGNITRLRAYNDKEATPQ